MALHEHHLVRRDRLARLPARGARLAGRTGAPRRRHLAHARERRRAICFLMPDVAGERRVPRAATRYEFRRACRPSSTLVRDVVLHSDPARFGLLYRLLWRLVHEPGLRHDPLDADRVQAQHMAQAVRRDMHKMKAFVRFRTARATTMASAPLHVAWFEPDHHIVEAVAPFFVRRFTQMRWAILTPERCAALGRPRQLLLRPRRAARRRAAGRRRRGAVAHLLPQHLQSRAAQARR